MAERKITIELTLEEADYIVDSLDDTADSAIDTKRDLINDRDREMGPMDEDDDEMDEVAEQVQFIDDIRRLQFRIKGAIDEAVQQEKGPNG